MYKIAIPSYRRSAILSNTTIPMLIAGGIKKIYLFIESSDLNNYIDQCDNLDIEIQYCLTEARGIGNVRNYVRDYFDIGTKVIMIDDDITGVYQRDEQITDLNSFIKEAFENCISVGSTLWGVQLFQNQFFLRDGITTKLTYINGSFTGFIKTKDEIYVDIDHFEDYLFSILHFLRDGVLCKFTDVWLKTKPFLQVGGICQQANGLEARKQQALVNGERLYNLFPEAVILKHSKKYDIQNIRLNHHCKWSSELANSAGLYLSNLENNDNW